MSSTKTILKLQDADGHWYWIPQLEAQIFREQKKFLEGKDYMEAPDHFDKFSSRFDKYATGGSSEIPPPCFKNLVHPPNQDLIDKLYAHRNLLFLNWLSTEWNWASLEESDEFWRSKKDWEGKSQGDWFIVGWDKNNQEGYVTYHLPMELWDKANFCTEIDCARWDGHSSEDVLERLKSLL